MTNSSDHTNKIINVTFKGGILGLLADSPQNSLNDKIQKENANGWKVIQVIPAESGNLFLNIFRFVLLVCTLFFYTTANGYYVVMEKVQREKEIDNENPSIINLKCSRCGKEFSSNNKGILCEECGNLKSSSSSTQVVSAKIGNEPLMEVTIKEPKEESKNDELMRKYNIIMEQDLYVYDGYKYNQLIDAVNYAKRAKSKNVK